MSSVLPLAAVPSDLVVLVESALEKRFGALRSDTGGEMMPATRRSDYLIHLNDEAEARQVAEAMRRRGVASGVRQEPGRSVLRLSRDDLIAAFADPSSHAHEGQSAREWLNEWAAPAARSMLASACA